MFWPMMTSSQESHFLVNFWDFSKNFSKTFLKIYKIGARSFRRPLGQSTLSFHEYFSCVENKT